MQIYCSIIPARVGVVSIEMNSLSMCQQLQSQEFPLVLLALLSRGLYINKRSAALASAPGRVNDSNDSYVDTTWMQPQY